MNKNSEDEDVLISTDGPALSGTLCVPDEANGLILFAHGSGSSRHSRRNRFVARILHQGGLATLLFDLLTEEEDTIYENRFDLELLSRRLIEVTNWAWGNPSLNELPLGYFGASTGAAAALVAAAHFGARIGAVVSRGGRPDLAKSILHRVQSPTLLVVGGNDDEVIALNKLAYARIIAPKRLEIVPGATHLFEEPGTLEEAARLSQEWFLRHLVPQPAGEP